SFNSAKVIYILIPILIIPQLLFSGVIVKFDKLHPWFASQSSVPWIGNVMASRWAYEGMAVAQFKDNEFEKLFYPLKKNKSFAKWKKDYWVKDLETKVSDVRRGRGDTAQLKKLQHDLEILYNEINGEMNFVHGVTMRLVDKLVPKDKDGQIDPKQVDDATLNEAEKYLGILKQHYRNVFNDNEKSLDKLTQRMQKDSVDASGKLVFKGAERYDQLKSDYANESLENFVTNYAEFDYTVEENGHLVQKKELIYRDPYDKGFFGAHFYAPRKRLFGTYIDTYWANAIVVWAMTLILCITLYFDALKRLLEAFGKIRLFPKKKR
ncbi:MAG TPA: hypothetical protein VD905_19140, partial [Flavobacteriales bacterium]|nr:hypothetical protein [Flavobacteriales bacterium]